MKKLLYPLIIAMVITLAFGYFDYKVSAFTQILLVISIIAVISTVIFQKGPTLK